MEKCGNRKRVQASQGSFTLSSPQQSQVLQNRFVCCGDSLSPACRAVAMPSNCGCTNLATNRGRRSNALLILTIAIAPVLALIIQNSISVEINISHLNSYVGEKDEVLLSTASGNVVHCMQIERGTSALYISSNGQSGLDNLNDTYRDTNEAIDSLSRWLDKSLDGPQFVNLAAFHQDIRVFRERVMSVQATVSEILAFYSEDIQVVIGWLADSLQLWKSGTLCASLVGYHMLIISKELAGQERAMGSTFFAQGGFTSDQMINYMEKKVLGQSYLQRFIQYSKGVTLLGQQFIGSQLQATINDMRSTILANDNYTSDVQTGRWWFDNMTLYINILKDTQDQTANEIVKGLETEISQQKHQLVVSISIMCAAVILLFIVIVSVSRLTKRLQTFAMTLQEKTVALNIERKRSENLLNELLPAKVAQKLMANEPVEPESFPAVTIFFSDIVGFTSISSKSSPLQVINMLNMLYKTFDEILDLYLVYKVETIGDAYMIASGLPVRNEEGHAVEMAELALELRDTICHMSVPHIPDQLIQIRIGLNSGSVVSGIVGYKMPRYCLFGDTVNVASRMESSGVPAKIQITGSTFQELTRKGGFLMEKRGEVEIKGKGMMTTYFLMGQTTHALPRRTMPRNFHI